MTSVGAQYGDMRVVDRSTIFASVIDLYSKGDIINECPLQIKFASEMAIDAGGVTREMFSAFWEQAYQLLFDGATLLIPLLHPQSDMSLFPILGKIISHGYLSSGYLPVRIALPSLIGILLGPNVSIIKQFQIDALLDYLNTCDREKLKSALNCSCSFSDTVKADVISILSQLGCREIPTSENIANLIEGVAQFEFCCKPVAAMSMINSGIPQQHREFWKDLGINGIKKLYDSLVATPDKVLSLIDASCANKAEERILGYLKSLIGNMGADDLRNFLRFTTGSSVCVAESITINFNSVTGLARRPFAHTCSNVLELPVAYNNYDFSAEWSAILHNTSNQWNWHMDSC